MLGGKRSLRATSLHTLHAEGAVTHAEGAVTGATRKSPYAVLVALLTVLAACGDDSATGPENSPPSASISSPSDASARKAGDTVTFAGSASDPEDGSLGGDALVWKSDVGGRIGTGTEVTSRGLSAASHTVTLTATDSEGATAADTITLTISQPPTTSIEAPPDSSIYDDGESISFSGSAEDPEDGALSGDNLVWRSDVDGKFGTGSTVSTSSLSSAYHVITLTATDSDGISDRDTVRVGVHGPPAVSILTPDTETASDEGASVTFGGSATDHITGPVPDSAYEWSSDVDGTLGTGDTISVSSLTAGPHTIRLTATDGDGDAASDSIRMVVEAPGFDFRLRFIDEFTATERDSIRSALQPWLRAITGDLSPHFPSSDQASDCQLTRKGIDDVVLAVRARKIDGEGGTLARGGPCLARTDGNGSYTTSISGIITIDQADRDDINLGQVGIHEVGHSLGIGARAFQGWDSGAVGLSTMNPHFTGQNAVGGFNDYAGAKAYLNEGIPLALTGSHWREVNFDAEAMSGYINRGVDMPVSKVSIGALADLGYSVDMTAAETFSFPMPQRTRWMANADATLSGPASSGENFGTPNGAVIDSVLVTGTNAEQYWSSDPEGETFEGLVRFGVSSSLPSGVSVDTAGILLEVAGRRVGTSSHSVNLYAVTSQWTEDAVTWDSSPSARDTAVLGFDYESCSSCLLGSSRLTRLATDWLDGSEPNHGLLIRAPDADTDSTFSIGFHSRHAGSRALRPRLHVDASTTSSALRTGTGDASTDELVPLGDDLRSGPVYGVDSEGRTIRVTPVRGEVRPR